MLKLRKNKKGFTLVELIVVIAIMAVLAGVVAGVTVSQLNKQTDKTGQSQANTIAQFLSQCALTGEGDEKITQADASDETSISFNQTLINNVLKKQYSSSSIEVGTTGGRGKISVTLITAAVGDVPVGSIKIYYQSKQSGTTGDVTYYVQLDGTITKVTPTTGG